MDKSWPCHCVEYRQIRIHTEVLKLYFQHYKETIKLGKDMKQLLTLLKEEVQTARDQEKTAECQRKTSLAFVSQQQEVLANLTCVKGNVNIKLHVTILLL